MRASYLLVFCSASLLIGCAATTPAQQLAYLESHTAHTDGHLTGSRLHQDISQYDPALIIIGPSSFANSGDNTVTSGLAHSPAYPDLQFYSR